MPETFTMKKSSEGAFLAVTAQTTTTLVTSAARSLRVMKNKIFQSTKLGEARTEREKPIRDFFM